MRSIRFLGIALLLVAAAPSTRADDPPAAKGDSGRPRSIAEATQGFRKIDGFLPLYWDAAKGRLLLEARRPGREFLYQEALATGLGSNPVGLDRGQLGESRVVVFRRVGSRMLLVEPNQKFRAQTDRLAERRAVEESFAPAVHAAFAIEAEEADGRALVDATAFFLRDAHEVADRLRRAKQGTYRLDAARSVVEPDRIRGFPRNMELDVLLTYTADGDPGPLVAETAAAPRAVTLRQHHSLVELPELGKDFAPRRSDPRVGYFGVDFHDFATPIDVPIEQRWIARHRLRKKDPNAGVSEATEPIVYYVDPGAPEPIRSALVEGASWWSEAFEAAGFRNGFRVAVLPDDADPMDLRFNVIQWVHRSTRGWSYGNTVIDPRTGEILKGRVTLDSLRARQDILIGGGLVGNTEGRSDACHAAAGPDAEHLAALDPKVEPGAMVLARIRQLSAHEVGHTLGLAHNFAASTYGRASVMDYPAPLVKISDGKIDLSEAYGKGIGAYDRFAISYGYSQFAPGTDEPKALGEIVRKGVAEGMLFLSDVDARAAGSANPLANLWDNGSDPVAALRQTMDARRIALDRFGIDRIREGQALSDLEATFLPVYLHHRYQLQAAIKTIGGMNYTYAAREGDGSIPRRVAEIVPAQTQLHALSAVLECVEPRNLVIPERVLALIPPVAFASGGGTAEIFPRGTGRVFDPGAAMTIAADLAIGGLLHPERATRLERFHARNAEFPALAVILRRIRERTWRGSLPADPRERAATMVARHLVVSRLIDLAGNDAVAPDVRAIAERELRQLSQAAGSTGEPVGRFLQGEIERFLSRPNEPGRRTAPPPAPPGDPIGQIGGAMNP